MRLLKKINPQIEVFKFYDAGKISKTICFLRCLEVRLDHWPDWLEVSPYFFWNSNRLHDRLDLPNPFPNKLAGQVVGLGLWPPWKGHPCRGLPSPFCILFLNFFFFSYFLSLLHLGFPYLFFLFLVFILIRTKAIFHWAKSIIAVRPNYLKFLFIPNIFQETEFFLYIWTGWPKSQPAYSKFFQPFFKHTWKFVTLKINTVYQHLIMINA